MERSSTRYWQAPMVGLMMVVTVGCGTSSSGGSSGSSTAQAINGGPALDRLRSAGQVTIAIANEPPYTKLNPDGSVTGMVPDLVIAVMAKLGVPHVKGIVTSYESMIPGLVANQWDIVAAGLTQTAKRCQQVLFSEPDTVSAESMVSLPSKNISINSFAGIAANPQINLVAIPGNLEETTALAKGVSRSQLVAAPDLNSAIDAVKAGRGDVTIAPTLSLKSSPAAQGLTLTKLTDSKVLGTGIAFRMGDKALRDAFDTVFMQLKHDGTFLALAKKWGFDGPLAVTTTRADVEPACAG